LSRCLQFNLKPMPVQLVVSHLGEVLERENVPAEPAALMQLARAANGSMRDALSLADQAIAYGGGKLEAAAVEAMLGSVGSEHLFALLDALAAGQSVRMMELAEGLGTQGFSFDGILQDLGTLLTRIALLQLAPDAAPEEASDAPRLRELAQTLDSEAVQLYYQIALNGRKDLPFAPDEISGFRMTLLRMLAFATGAEPAPARTRPEPAAAPVNKPAIAESQAQVAKPPTMPAPAAAEIPEGDWHQQIASLNLGGMARMLADHCELVTREPGKMVFALDPVHKHLADKSFQDKFIAALKTRFGAGLDISITVGATQGLSPVEIRNREKSRRQSEAVAAIENDPFVRELVEAFDATVNEASILPVDPGDTQRTKP
ncbi:MAG TPA: DNA polymerase III subunit gamma/tau C-terminal domain-containing protein, partial [Thiobacillaceae bacterium]|nr:DNA polymerase III subunit gamma/tau C-terminal domain-containing protein [Thiobacillaceae bacterium]